MQNSCTQKSQGSEVKDHAVRNRCGIQPQNKHDEITTQEYILSSSIPSVTSLWKAFHRSVSAKIKEHLDMI